MKPLPPQPVKLFCGLLYSDETLLEWACENLQQAYGQIDYRSAKFDFTITDYYVPEMGAPIWRQFISFFELIDPARLARIKIECNAIEDELASQGMRKVNLDPGYLDYDKVVLASAKYNANKVYLDFGIYADPTLFYERGHYCSNPHSFPDFKSGLYEAAFLHIRAQYKGRLRKIQRGG